MITTNAGSKLFAMNRPLPTPQLNLGGNVWHAEVSKRTGMIRNEGSQTGPVLAGPGALRAQAQATLEVIRNTPLPILTPEQKEMVDKAKKYAMEQSIKSVVLKQTLAQTQSQQKTLQRNQALVLMCRIYVGSISFELKEETVRNAFRPFGPVRAINMSYDTVTGRHKGFAFVEFELPEAAQLALDQMNGILLGGRNIKVGRPSNMPQAAPVLDQIMEETKTGTRIYVSSIHKDLSEVDVHGVFEAFGKIKSCKLAPGVAPGEKHREFGFIEYETPQAASDAIASLNMFDLGGQYLRVGRAITPPECAINPNGLVLPPPPSLITAPMPTAAAVAAAAAAAKIQAMESAAAQVQSHVLVAHSAAAAAAAQAALTQRLTTLSSVAPSILSPHLIAAVQAGAASTGAIPAVTVVDPLALKNKSSITSPSLAGMLAAVGLPSVVGAAIPPPALLDIALPQKRSAEEIEGDEDKSATLDDVNGANGGGVEEDLEEDIAIKGGNARQAMMKRLMRNKQSESRVMILKNMVGADEVDEELEPEITEECSRFGHVERVIIYQERQSEDEDAAIEVKIFVEFGQAAEMNAAIKALNGRYFGGRQVHARAYDMDLYDSNDLSG